MPSLTQAQINVALLTERDMPISFSVDLTKGSGSRPLCVCIGLAAVSDTPADTTAKGEAHFAAGVLGPYIEEDLAVQPGKAQINFDHFARALSSYPSLHVQNADGSPTFIRLAPLPFPRLGDETFSFQGTAQAPATLLTEDVVLVRLGDSLLLLENTKVTSPDSHLTELLARKAVDKVRNAR